MISQAGQMLYGTRFLPNYPQGHMKLGRFRGTKITGDILDNKQEHLHGFAIVREAMAFLERTLPVSGHFVEGRIEREDRLPVPRDALREVLLNAVMHRDYSHPGSHVAVAVFVAISVTLRLIVVLTTVVMQLVRMALIHSTQRLSQSAARRGRGNRRD